MDVSSRFQGLPEIIYGTAFKFEKTATLVEAALNAGFRAIDTAGSKHAYREALVGEGIAASLAVGNFKRKDLYIQTKFSPFKAGKDPASYPYDTAKSIPEQVAESVEASFSNLGVEYLDSLILHSSYPDIKDTLAAWHAMEALVPSKVTSIGLSNIDLKTLRQVCEEATIKPRAVQNRFTKDTIDKPDPTMVPVPYPLITFDRDVREYCREEGIAYAPWGLLWGSLDVLDGPEKILERIGGEIGISKEIACFACMRSLGGCEISNLCGTSNEGRMKETLTGLAKVQEYVDESDEHKQIWRDCVDSFRVVTDGSD